MFFYRTLTIFINAHHAHHAYVFSATGENVYYKGINKKAVSEQRARQDVAIAALPFRNAEELLQVCRREDMTIAQVVYENELKWRTREEIRDRIMAIWKTMDESIKNGVLADENE